MVRKMLLRIIILISIGSIFFVLPWSHVRARNKHPHIKVLKPTHQEQRAYQIAWHRRWHPHSWHFRGQHWWHYSGWRYGYWWGWNPYVWEGKVWGLGYSRYPWYWLSDSLALSLTFNGNTLYQLAEQKKWDDAVQLIEQRIKQVEGQMEVAKQKHASTKSIRRMERTIDRLERYLEDVEQYRHYN